MAVEEVTRRWALFTTTSLATIFITFGGLRLLLIKCSANKDGKFDYLPVTVNLCAEMIKLLVCSIMAVNVVRKGSEQLTICVSWQDVLRLFKWSVPGLLYFLDNLITFYVVASFEPAMVVLLNNFAIISTAVLFRLILKRKLGKLQWASLVILFLAIMCLSRQANVTHSSSDAKLMHHNKQGQNNESQQSSPTIKCNVQPGDYCSSDGLPICSTKIIQLPSWRYKLSLLGQYEGHCWVLLQCFLSSMANIYNEKIFKEGHGMEDSIYIQNTKLYLFGVFFNLSSIVFIDKYWERVTKCGLFHGYNKFSCLLIFVNAFMGLTVALILKFRDNMFHVLSAQILTVVVITLSVLLMGFKPSLEFFLQAPIVLLAIYIYNNSKDTETQSKDNLLVT
ncbi:UDP-sugar transporter protein SLC35A5-like [Asterias amurensis]|uniref:UDP-sugar transporter protein SLC35A5-like n=1 Tax=Asterias amurensis TaxID=7602 RepID=UPI003AB4256E